MFDQIFPALSSHLLPLIISDMVLLFDIIVQLALLTISSFCYNIFQMNKLLFQLQLNQTKLKQKKYQAKFYVFFMYECLKYIWSLKICKSMVLFECPIVCTFWIPPTSNHSSHLHIYLCINSFHYIQSKW